MWWTAVDGTVAAAYLLGGYFALAKVVREPKRRAWILTLLTAAVVAPGSLPYALASAIPRFDTKAVFQDARGAQFLCRFFVVFLALDCAVGFVHYRDHVGLFVGWVHHAVYIVFFSWIIHVGYSVGAATTLSLETPTFLLALGHCFPQRRHDLLYGLVFFTFRVAFHFWLFIHWCAIENPPHTLWPATGGTLVLHCTWFYKWCVMYAKIRRRPKQP